MDFFYRSPMFRPLFHAFGSLFKYFHKLFIGIPHAVCPYKGANMKNFKKTFRKLTTNQKGQGVMEYVIISSLIGIVCITAVKGFGDVIKERVEDMKKSIVHNIDNK